MGFMEGFVKGISQHLQTAQGADRDKALLLLKGVMEGKLDPKKIVDKVQNPQTEYQKPGMGQRILSGLGVTPSPEADASRYNVIGDTTERMKADLVRKEWESVMGINAPTTADAAAPATTQQPAVQSAANAPKTITIPTGQVDKYGRQEMKTMVDPQWEKEQAKIGEINAKKQELKQALANFGVVNNKIKRAAGGLAPTLRAGIRSSVVGSTQPIDPKTGRSTEESDAIRVYDGAIKNLRVKLVRAAGDVGNISVVEQEAAEKLIPNFYDSQSASNAKMEYMLKLTQAVESGNAGDIKKVLDDAGVGYVDLSQGGNTAATTPTGASTDYKSRYGLE